MDTHWPMKISEKNWNLQWNISKQFIREHMTGLQLRRRQSLTCKDTEYLRIRTTSVRRPWERITPLFTK